MVNVVKKFEDWFEGMDKTVSVSTIKRLLKAAGFRWRRVRKSLESQRDMLMYAFFKEEIKLLQQEHEQQKIRLVFYDESGISLNPNSVYAWLPKDNSAKLPATRGNIMTIAGFMQTDNTTMMYTHEGSTTSEIFIAYVDDYLINSPSLIKTIVIIDNASFHKSAQVKKKMIEWKSENLYFQFLPPYCSELNKIETLWHHIKHLWLKIEDYQSKQSLENAVIHILKNIKSKYTISFN